MDFIPFLVSGLVTGSIYGIAATGLVLTYKTSAVFNFAHGALATAAAFGFYALYVDHGLPWALAGALIVLVLAPLVGIALEILARALASKSLAVRVGSTVGLLLIVQAVIGLAYGTTEENTFPHYLSQASVTIGGAAVTVEDFVIVGLAVVSCAGLLVFFKVSRVGLAMRAVVDSPDLLAISGTNPQRVRRWAWIIGAAYAAVSGLLIAPLLVPLSSTAITSIVVTAFGAAAIGGFSSLTWTFFGGVLIGLAQALASKYFYQGFWSGLPPAMPFLVLFIVLLVAPQRKLGDRSRAIARTSIRWTTPGRVQIGAGAVVLVALAFVPEFVGIHTNDWSVALATTILLLSLGLLVRTSGQVSLCHVTFLAIGVCAMGQFTGRGIPWLPAVLLSGLVVVPIGALLAIPAIRLSGLYLALATFGFGLAVQIMFYTANFMFGSLSIPINVPRPHLSWISLDSDRGYYYVMLVATVLASAIVILINRSRLGRLLRGLADSVTGLATTGAAVNTTRVLVFCISAFIAGVAGALQVGVQPYDSSTFQPFTSLTYFALIVISVGGAPWYALVGGLGFTLIPVYWQGTTSSYWLTLLFGAGAVLYALTPPERMQPPQWLARPLDRLRGRARPRDTVDLPGAAPPVASGGTLAVEGLTVRFGGLVAVDNVSFAAPTGQITGLIGPNGAGKTTTFNAASGIVRPSKGRIILAGADVSRASVSVRARKGLGRTFQHMELFDSLTVRENIELGCEGGRAGRNPLSHLVAGRRDRRKCFAMAERAIRSCGLGDVAETQVASLSTGRRRLVELARCLAGEFQLLLLDEPSSGLDVTETEVFGEILRQAVRERGLGILLVEHDMSLVLSACDHIYVLDFGRLIFEGTAAETAASPLVRTAYLGGADAEVLTPPDEAIT